MHARTTAERLASQLFEMETAIDNAISKTATFAAAMPVARLEINASASLGHGALEAAIEVLALLAQARGAAVTSHEALAHTQKVLGLETVNFGGFVDKPERPAARRRLQLASAAAAA